MQAFITLYSKELKRFLRIWTQTLLPPIINQTLYLTIFGSIIGSQIGQIAGVSYIQFILPGLLMMSVVMGTYSNVVSSFFGSKFQRSVEELLVAPVSNFTILQGYCLGGISRGILAGLLVLLTSLVFSSFQIHSLSLVLIYTLLSSYVFAQAGFLNGLFAKKFDDVSIFPTFILNPLIFFGGVFYDINTLPAHLKIISQLNPITYMIEGYRYSFLGIQGQQTTKTILVLAIFAVLLTLINMHYLNKGKGLKS